MTTSGRSARARVRLLLVATIALLGAVVVSCGDDSWEEAVTTVPASTTAPTTTSTSSTTTSTTTTTMPSATVSGRVYLLDREEPVATAVDLYFTGEEGDEPAGTTRTDAEGYYSFSVEEAGSYEVRVSVIDLLDVCEGLRTEGEMSARWPTVSRILSGSGTTDVLAVSTAETVSIGDEVVFDLDLYCDQA